MATNYDDSSDNKSIQLIHRSQHLSYEQNLLLQRIIEEETSRCMNGTATVNNSLSAKCYAIYKTVKNRIASKFKDCRDNLDTIIFKITLFFLQGSQTLAIENNGNGRAKTNKKKGFYNESETVATYQCFSPQVDRRMEEERKITEEKRLNEVLRLSREHHEAQMEFEKRLNETMEQSYKEEKSKLLALFHTEDIDFDALANQLNKISSGKDVVHKADTMNDKSALILAIIEIFEHDYRIINAKNFQNHINSVHKRCLAIDSTVTYMISHHQIDCNSTFNVDTINECLINIQIRGDGNCLWNSVSHSLFGDYAMMKSLRLLTAASLMYYSEQFSEALESQASKFNYNHALTLEQLITESVSLQSWGDEFHILALSLALKRPIYSYGSLIHIPELAGMSYEQFRRIYELEQIPNHFKYIGDANNANNEPILLHYDGDSHYSAVLKRSHYVKPLVPFVQIIDPLIKHQDNEISGKAYGIVDDDSSIDIGLADDVERKSYDKVEQNKIAELRNILIEKDQRLQDYEKFYQNVKKMVVDKTINVMQLQHLVEDIENRL